jgi:replicative DNA helicase
VEFSDGESIVADAQHLWKTTTRLGRHQEGQQRASYYRAPEQLARLEHLVSLHLLSQIG